MKIQLCLIVSNAEYCIKKTLDTWINHVDSIHILLNNCTDNTKQILLNYNDKLTIYDSEFTNFAETRNKCLDLAYSPDYDFTIMIDDTYELNTKLSLKSILTRVPFMYECCYLTIKTDTIQYKSIRVIRTKSKLRFTRPIHEIIENAYPYDITDCFIYDRNYPQMVERTIARNYLDLEILEKQEKDPRTLFNIACTKNNLLKVGLTPIDDVIKAFIVRCNTPSEHKEETFFCYLLLGLLYSMNEIKGLNESTRMKKSVECLINASIIYPPRCAEAYYFIYELSQSKFWLEKAYKCLKYYNPKLIKLPYNKEVYEKLIKEDYNKLHRA